MAIMTATANSLCNGLRFDAQVRVKDADKTDVADRDLVHGDGGTIDIPVKPSDIAKDD